jgi:hypothetical protein
MSDKIFADGFYFDPPHANAPNFVVGKVNIQVAKAIAFLQANANSKGYVNLSIKEAKSGKPYMELDTWEPGQAKPVDTATAFAGQGMGDAPPQDDLPF